MVAWESGDGLLSISVVADRVIVDTFNHESEPARLTAAEARLAAAALIVLAEGLERAVAV